MQSNWISCNRIPYLYMIYIAYSLKVNLGFLQLRKNISKDGKRLEDDKENTYGQKENIWSKTHLNQMSWFPFLKCLTFPF